MKVEYSLTVPLDIPEGSKINCPVDNQITLPDGKIISVHPVIEMHSSEDSDDHHDLTTKDAEEVGISFALFDRTLEEIKPKPVIDIFRH